MTDKRTAKSESEVREELQLRIRTEGVQVAYDTALGICRDAEAPAPAKATALTALFRVAGYFEKTEGSATKDLSEMDADELAAVHARLERQLEALERAGPIGDADGPDDDGGPDRADRDNVFG